MRADARVKAPEDTPRREARRFVVLRLVSKAAASPVERMYKRRR